MAVRIGSLLLVILSQWSRFTTLAHDYSGSASGSYVDLESDQQDHKYLPDFTIPPIPYYIYVPVLFVVFAILVTICAGCIGYYIFCRRPIQSKKAQLGTEELEVEGIEEQMKQREGTLTGEGKALEIEEWDTLPGERDTATVEASQEEEVALGRETSTTIQGERAPLGGEEATLPAEEAMLPAESATEVNQEATVEGESTVEGNGITVVEERTTVEGEGTIVEREGTIMKGTTAGEEVTMESTVVETGRGVTVEGKGAAELQGEGMTEMTMIEGQGNQIQEVPPISPGKTNAANQRQNFPSPTKYDSNSLPNELIASGKLAVSPPEASTLPIHSWKDSPKLVQMRWGNKKQTRARRSNPLDEALLEVETRMAETSPRRHSSADQETTPTQRSSIGQGGVFESLQRVRLSIDSQGSSKGAHSTGFHCSSIGDQNLQPVRNSSRKSDNCEETDV